MLLLDLIACITLCILYFLSNVEKRILTVIIVISFIMIPVFIAFIADVNKYVKHCNQSVSQCCKRGYVRSMVRCGNAVEIHAQSSIRVGRLIVTRIPQVEQTDSSSRSEFDSFAHASSLCQIEWGQFHIDVVVPPRVAVSPLVFRIAVACHMRVRRRQQVLGLALANVVDGTFPNFRFDVK